MVVTGNEIIGSINPRNERRNDDGCENDNSSNLNHNANLGRSHLDERSGLLSITSSHHSEIHLDNSRFKEDPILQSFRLAKSERVLGLERTEYRYKLNRLSSDTDSSESSLDLNDEDLSETNHDNSNLTSLKNKYETKKQPKIISEDNTHSSLPPDLSKVSETSKRRLEKR